MPGDHDENEAGDENEDGDENEAGDENEDEDGDENEDEDEDEAYIQKTSSVAVMAMWAKKIGVKFGLKMA